MNKQGFVPLCCGSLVNEEDFGAPAPWSIGGSPTRHRPSDLVWSSDDNLVRGMWKPPSFVEKLLSGTRDQGDHDCVHGRDLIAEHVDVGVPLWLTESRDKSSCQRVCFLSSLL